MTTLLVHPATRPLVGSVPVPSDKSIGHRALLFGALACVFFAGELYAGFVPSAIATATATR